MEFAPTSCPSQSYIDGAPLISIFEAALAPHFELKLYQQYIETDVISIVTYPTGGPRSWADHLHSRLARNYPNSQSRIYTSRIGYLQAMAKRHTIVHSSVPLPFVRAEKFILTIHGDYTKEKLIGKVCFPPAINEADHVTVPSVFLKNALDIPRAHVIPNGVDIPAKGKLTYSLVEDSITVGTMTNFHFQEKAMGVIRLAEILRNSLPKANFLIAGEGRHLHELQANVRRIFPLAKFIGRCTPSHFFQEIDLFAYVSFLDNQPLSVLEAMAFGLPVLSNPVGAVAEIFENELSRAMPRSDDEYCATIFELSESEVERWRLGTDCRLRAKDFSWETIGARFHSLYSD